MTVFDFPERSEGLRPVDDVDRSEVRIEVRAQPSRLAPVRVVAADLAARADFDLDAVGDLRIAVDEACSALVGLAAAGAWLRCSMEVTDDRITVVASVPVAVPAVISRKSFGWRVLSTLTDHVEVLGGRSEGSTLAIRLVKYRQAVSR